jgi:hypothetical protein
MMRILQVMFFLTIFCRFCDKNNFVGEIQLHLPIFEENFAIFSISQNFGGKKNLVRPKQGQNKKKGIKKKKL